MGKMEIAICYPPSWFEAGEVIVMARAKGYAMVRRTRCAPFVVKEIYLLPKEPKP